MTGTPFLQRTRRFSFEVENDEVFFGSKNLSEVIVAVYPDALPALANTIDAADPLQQCLTLFEQLPGCVTQVLGKRRQFRGQQIEHRGGFLLEVRAKLFQLIGSEGLRRERRTLGTREREMHVSGTTAEDAGCSQIPAFERSEERRRFRPLHRQQEIAGV